MAKRFKHRKPHYLRAFAVIAWALQGIFASWSPPAHAANPDTIALTVRAGSSAPPASIADLMASPNPSVPGQISLTWTSPQGNVGGTPLPNLTVASYTVHLATFSVDSLLGNTTSWWNATTAGGVTLQPPGYIPQSPGSLEAYSFSGLIEGATYYFGVRSTNPSSILSLVDAKMATPGQQASAVAARTLIPSHIPPRMPNGLLSTSLSNGLQVRLSWTPVTEDITGQPIPADHYLVYRYSVLGGSPTATITVPGNTAVYTDNTGGLLRYYRIQAVNAFGDGSQLSDYLDSSGENNRYTLAPDDPATRIVMPEEAARYLLAANNPWGKDLYLAITHRPTDEVNVTLKSYKFSAHIAETDEEISGFSFPQNNISVELGYGSALQAIHRMLPASQHGQISAGSLAQIISVYWFNGATFVPVGNPILTSGQSIAVTVRNIGVYQIRAVTLGTKFRMAPGSPYPRVITPNGAENRRVFFIFENPADDQVSGTIYDLRGAEVRRLEINGMSPTPNTLVWDGRDSQGAVVPSGIYLYKLSTAEEIITGTVVVAR
jgi:hypothetical protein